MQIDPLNAILVSLIPDLANLYLGLLSIMIGGFVVYGKHWGQTRWNTQFQSPTKLFAWLVLSILTGYVLIRFATPIVQNWLSGNVIYLIGTTTAFFGAFFLWFLRSGNWKLTTRPERWVPLVVLYAVTALNVLAYHQGDSLSSSETSFIAIIVALTVLAWFFSRSTSRAEDSL